MKFDTPCRVAYFHMAPAGQRGQRLLAARVLHAYTRRGETAADVSSSSRKGSGFAQHPVFFASALLPPLATAARTAACNSSENGTAEPVLCCDICRKHRPTILSIAELQRCPQQLLARVCTHRRTVRKVFRRPCSPPPPLAGQMAAEETTAEDTAAAARA